VGPIAAQNEEIRTMWNASVKSLDDGNTSLRTDRMNGKTVLGNRIPHTAPLDLTIYRAGVAME
jgi:hypothetical protein